MGWIHADDRSPEERFADGAADRQRADALAPGRSPGVDLVEARLTAARAEKLTQLLAQAIAVGGTVRLVGDGWDGWQRYVMIPGRRGRVDKGMVMSQTVSCQGAVEVPAGVWLYYADLRGVGFRLRKWA